MNSIVRVVHKYNDYAVVVLNIEFFILRQWLAKPIPVESEVEQKKTEAELQEEAHYDGLRHNLDMVLILYLNFLVIKQIIL